MIIMKDFKGSFAFWNDFLFWEIIFDPDLDTYHLTSFKNAQRL